MTDNSTIEAAIEMVVPANPIHREADFEHGDVFVKAENMLAEHLGKDTEDLDTDDWRMFCRALTGGIDYYDGDYKAAFRAIIPVMVDRSDIEVGDDAYGLAAEIDAGLLQVLDYEVRDYLAAERPSARDLAAYAETHEDFAHFDGGDERVVIDPEWIAKKWDHPELAEWLGETIYDAVNRNDEPGTPGAWYYDGVLLIEVRAAEMGGVEKGSYGQPGGTPDDLYAATREYVEATRVYVAYLVEGVNENLPEGVEPLTAEMFA